MQNEWANWKPNLDAATATMAAAEADTTVARYLNSLLRSSFRWWETSCTTAIHVDSATTKAAHADPQTASRGTSLKQQ